MLLRIVSGHLAVSKLLIIDSQYSLPVLTSSLITTFGISRSNFINSGKSSFHLYKKKFGGLIFASSIWKIRKKWKKSRFDIYPVHLGSPTRNDSRQYWQSCVNSCTRSFGNSMNIRVIKSNVCFDVISHLFISSRTAINTANRLLAIDSEFDSNPINR